MPHGFQMALAAALPLVLMLSDNYAGLKSCPRHGILHRRQRPSADRSAANGAVRWCRPVEEQQQRGEPWGQLWEKVSQQNNLP